MNDSLFQTQALVIQIRNRLHGARPLDSVSLRAELTQLEVLVAPLVASLARTAKHNLPLEQADLQQEMFLILYQDLKSPDYRSMVKFGAYLKLLPARALRVLRKQYGGEGGRVAESLDRPLRDEEHATYGDQVADPAAEAEIQQMLAASELDAAVATLSGHERQIVQLLRDGMKQRAIATQLGMTDVQMSRAVRQIARQLRPLLEPE